MTTPPSRHTKPPEDPFVCLDYGKTTMEKFPSTADKAEQVWTDFLNEKNKEGLTFVGVFRYPLGAERRTMIVFKR